MSIKCITVVNTASIAFTFSMLTLFLLVVSNTLDKLAEVDRQQKLESGTCWFNSSTRWVFTTEPTEYLLSSATVCSLSNSRQTAVGMYPSNWNYQPDYMTTEDWDVRKAAWTVPLVCRFERCQWSPSNSCPAEWFAYPELLPSRQYEIDLVLCGVVLGPILLLSFAVSSIGILAWGCEGQWKQRPELRWLFRVI